MRPVCILTDSTALFTGPKFPGWEQVCVYPLHVGWEEQQARQRYALRPGDLPDSLRNGRKPALLIPSAGELRSLLLSLAKTWGAILVLGVSSQLCPLYAEAQEAVETLQGAIAIQLLDSRAAGTGLGLLVQAAAQAAAQGASLEEVKLQVTGLIPHLFSIYCVQGLTYLAQSGQMEMAQALVGEMLGVQPVVMLENGRLIPQYKIQNSHHLIEQVIEFLAEFQTIQHIALSQGPRGFLKEARTLKTRITNEYPRVPFSEHTFSTSLTALLGPHSLGISVLSG